MTTAGYSGTPLSKKLGIVAQCKVVPINAPKHYRQLLAPIAQGVEFGDAVAADTDIVHLFTMHSAELADWLSELRHSIRPDCAVWVSWPKKASKVATDITENTIRGVCLPLGFVDIKVCAVDETWSGLKLVIRKALR